MESLSQGSGPNEPIVYDTTTHLKLQTSSASLPSYDNANQMSLWSAVRRRTAASCTSRPTAKVKIGVLGANYWDLYVGAQSFPL